MPTAASVSVTAVVRRATTLRRVAYFPALLGLAFFLAACSRFRTGFFLLEGAFLPRGAFPILDFPLEGAFPSPGAFPILDFPLAGASPSPGAFPILDFPPEGAFPLPGAFPILDFPPAGAFPLPGAFPLLAIAWTRESSSTSVTSPTLLVESHLSRWSTDPWKRN